MKKNKTQIIRYSAMLTSYGIGWVVVLLALSKLIDVTVKASPLTNNMLYFNMLITLLALYFLFNLIPNAMWECYKILRKL